MRQPESRLLFDRIASFENLYQAAAESRRGKRFKDATARFDGLVKFRKVGPAILPASPLSSGLLGVFEESLLESRLAARIGGPTYNGMVIS